MTAFEPDKKTKYIKYQRLVLIASWIIAILNTIVCGLILSEIVLPNEFIKYKVLIALICGSVALISQLLCSKIHSYLWNKIKAENQKARQKLEVDIRTILGLLPDK